LVAVSWGQFFIIAERSFRTRTDTMRSITDRIRIQEIRGAEKGTTRLWNSGKLPRWPLQKDQGFEETR
jgi:hypothetical protein